jgi:hypothetical protein
MRARVAALVLVLVATVSGAAAQPEAARAPAPEPAAEPDAEPASSMSARRTAAWIFAGVAIGAMTGGVVMAIAAEASEKDLQDLYDFRAGGRPPAFDGAARDRYDAVLVQGERYELLAWIGISLAVAAGGTAGALFYFDRREVRVAPQLAGDGRGGGIIGTIYW